ncbi:hypothetical protein [Methylobacterium sp. Leaf118]|uniref:hypothetical protein n=1 Tax=Methylobacterium sp. Leaf118 TaxID=2876562 RepID=UPI001E3924B5|nr:hypothetical protein [Methylobacterium sp. Leaf118]
MILRNALLLVGGTAAAAGLYLAWALTSPSGYEAGGRAIKAQIGFLTMPHAERQSLRKLALMKAAGHCEWDLDRAFWGRIYDLYVGEERGVRAAVYATLLDEQERYFLADADQRRCRAAWVRFGVEGADIRGILRPAGTEAAPASDTVVNASAEAN